MYEKRKHIPPSQDFKERELTVFLAQTCKNFFFFLQDDLTERSNPEMLAPVFAVRHLFRCSAEQDWVILFPPVIEIMFFFLLVCFSSQISLVVVRVREYGRKT